MSRLRRAARLAACVCLAVPFDGCAEPREHSRSPADAQQATPTAASDCPVRVAAPPLLAGTRAEQLTLDYWLARYDAAALDAPLLTPEEIDAYNARVGRRPGAHEQGQRDLSLAPDRLEVEHDVATRLGFMLAKLRAGEYVLAGGRAMPDDARAAFEAPLPALEPALRVALADTQLQCGPHAGAIFASGGDERFDRNACSAVRAQDPIQLLARWPNGMLLARTRYALGWIAADTRLAPFPDSLPASPRRALTRRALLTTAFEFIGSPYGFGGAKGGRDCSSLQLDLFERFDIALPRHSGWQAKAGSYRFDVSAVAEGEKLALIDRVARDGAVLLAFPGHIMLYLGKSTEGVPMVLHALGEYAQPCPGGADSVVDVQRVVVSDLELGRGSTRRSLAERIESVVVLGRGPAPELAGRAILPSGLPARPDAAAECRDDVDRRIFVSPRRPLAGEALRVIATASEDPQGAQLWLWDPEGRAHAGPTHRLGGPPWAEHTRVGSAASGTWTAALARGEEILACKRFRVGRDATVPARDPSLVWEPRWSWERDTENLWSAFVEQLFDFPLDDDRTWTSLHALLRDPDRNLLHGHLGLEEDERFELVPDCADLPYTLRAYFSWKLSLPYGYRQCSRGRPGRPPTCGALHTNLEAPASEVEVEAFDRFVNRGVRSGVHSATGRTHPDDDETDLYPVALERAALAPGTVYADPYGHVMMVVRWVPQGTDATSPYGVLVAGEAQPDGTLGRRRFWEGTFLFDPSTQDTGAGFKRFRPLVRDPAQGGLRALTNEELREIDLHGRWSRMQYEGSKADFYDRIDALVNPRPLAPAQRLASLVDALDEAVRRRVLAVANGEGWVAEHPGASMPMPVGDEVFETTGPWEDFSTPSRDMRLLIAIDTVLGLPERVRRAPQRFGLRADEVERAASELRTELEAELARRRFEYTKSNGHAQSLTLADVVARSAALEVAYNPNDCVEARWGAPEGSAERATCKRRAPAEQAARMERYRTWFHTRTRPPRGTRTP